MIKTKKISLAIILIAFSLNIYSQDSPTELDSEVFNSNFNKLKIRHIKGMHALDAKFMYAYLGPAYELNYSYLATDRLSLHAGFYYETAKLAYTDFNYKNVKLGVEYSMFKIKQRLYINPDASFLIGVIDAKNSDLAVSENYFNCAASLGLHVEAYIFNKLSLLLVADQQYNIKDKFGHWHYNIGGGLRVYLN